MLGVFLGEGIAGVFNADLSGRDAVVAPCVGAGTLKLESKVLRDEARPYGFVVAMGRAATFGVAGSGRSAVGFTVACMRAIELAVGAYSVEERLIVAGRGTGATFSVYSISSSIGGAGAGRAVRMMSA